MEKTPINKQLVKELQSKLKALEGELALAQKLEGIDANLTVKITENQAHSERIRIKGKDDKALGKFLLELTITATQEAVFIPLSIASGKKPAGFMYLIEGTAEGTIATAEVKCRGEGVTQVTLGTLLFAKIPAGKTAVFRIQTTIRGKFGKTYKIIIGRINYKLNLTDARYMQYLKALTSDHVKFS